jgi:hypothetical protein
VSDEDGRKAIGLYAVAARDMCDFIDMVKEEVSNETLATLYRMLTYPNPEMSKDNKELNALAAPFVKSELEKRGVSH